MQQLERQRVRRSPSCPLQSHVEGSLSYMRPCGRKKDKSELSVYQDRVSLGSPECPGTHRDLRASTSLILGGKACGATPSRFNNIFIF